MDYINLADDEELYIVRKFARIDETEEDDVVSIMIGAAKEMIADAVGSYDTKSSRHKLLMLSIVSTLYDNRSYASGEAQQKAQYVLKTMLHQLQIEEG